MSPVAESPPKKLNLRAALNTVAATRFAQGGVGENTSPGGGYGYSGSQKGSPVSPSHSGRMVLNRGSSFGNNSSQKGGQNRGQNQSPSQFDMMLDAEEDRDQREFEMSQRMGDGSAGNGGYGNNGYGYDEEDVRQASGTPGRDNRDNSAYMGKSEDRYPVRKGQSEGQNQNPSVYNMRQLPVQSDLPTSLASILSSHSRANSDSNSNAPSSPLSKAAMSGFGGGGGGGLMGALKAKGMIGAGAGNRGGEGGGGGRDSLKRVLFDTPS